MKNKYFLTAVCMYLNYIVIGVSVIILSMNMDALMKQFGTDRTGFGLVVSGIGIGKFIVLFISGVLSDKFGRKPFILIGMVGFIVYFMGILLSPNVPIALFFAVLAGMCNSFIDAGTYPALMEIFPTSAGTANLAIKFFSAAGQFIMPFIFSFIIQKNLNYSLSFYIVIGYLVLNIVFMFTRGFPALSTQSGAAEKEVKRTFYEKPKMAIEGVCLILMGFTSTTIFTVVQVWMAKVAEEYAGMSVAAASKMLTYFSLGVVIGVFVTGYLVRDRIRPIVICLIYPLITMVCLIALTIAPLPLLCFITVMVTGFTSGMLQLGLTTMAELFPGSKGKITGMVYSLNSIAVFSAPVITGWLANTNTMNTMVYNAAVSGLAFVLALIVFVRYKKVFGPEAFISMKEITNLAEASK